MRELAADLAPRVLANPSRLSRVYTQLVTRGVRPTEELATRLAAEAGGVGPGLRAAVVAIAAAGRSPDAFHRRSVHYRGSGGGGVG